MKKILISLLATSVLLSSCSSNTEPSSSNSSSITSQSSSSSSSVSSTPSTTEITDEDNNEDIEVDSPTLPCIDGSFVYDIVLGLDELGIPKPETLIGDDFYTWNSYTLDYGYNIIGSKDQEIAAATFTILSETADLYYLRYCSSINYDEGDPDTAMLWVEENIGTEATTTIGDAKFTLGITVEDLPYLSIEDVDLATYTIED